MLQFHFPPASVTADEESVSLGNLSSLEVLARMVPGVGLLSSVLCAQCDFNLTVPGTVEMSLG